MMILEGFSKVVYFQLSKPFRPNVFKGSVTCPGKPSLFVTESEGKQCSSLSHSVVQGRDCGVHREEWRQVDSAQRTLYRDVTMLESYSHLVSVELPRSTMISLQLSLMDSFSSLCCLASQWLWMMTTSSWKHSLY
ncbi:zinc finger protein 585A-like [Diceros bicornis minor]|uniref:zinc finger protein 585A-like n=1 Tax=Diceros bicornis minor TaxID=77932 RepID=UPI0026EAD597|nr:zinc finger protein 585A-like [Diceros bicornis minor]